MIIDQDKSNVENTPEYWKSANDVKASIEMRIDTFDTEVNIQSDDSNAWPTLHSGTISNVTILEKNVDEADAELTNGSYGFLSYYTRYDNTSVYGNGLGVKIITMLNAKSIVYVCNLSRTLGNDHLN